MWMHCVKVGLMFVDLVNSFKNRVKYCKIIHMQISTVQYILFTDSMIYILKTKLTGNNHPGKMFSNCSKCSYIVLNCFDQSHPGMFSNCSKCFLVLWTVVAKVTQEKMFLYCSELLWPKSLREDVLKLFTMFWTVLSKIIQRCSLSVLELLWRKSLREDVLILFLSYFDMSALDCQSLKQPQKQKFSDLKCQSLYSKVYKSLSLSLSLCLTHTHSHILPLHSHILPHTHTPSPTHTHTHTHTHTDDSTKNTPSLWDPTLYDSIIKHRTVQWKPIKMTTV